MMRNDDNPITLDLFADETPTTPGQVEQIGPQSFVLRGFALPWLDRLLPALETVLQAAPFRQMVTPGGFTMSVLVPGALPGGGVDQFARLDAQASATGPDSG